MDEYGEQAHIQDLLLEKVRFYSRAHLTEEVLMDLKVHSYWDQVAAQLAIGVSAAIWKGKGQPVTEEVKRMVEVPCNREWMVPERPIDYLLVWLKPIFANPSTTLGNWLFAKMRPRWKWNSWSAPHQRIVSFEVTHDVQYAVCPHAPIVTDSDTHQHLLWLSGDQWAPAVRGGDCDQVTEE